ncbi:glycosyltransferase [Clostridium felsineum]|uniref:Undecaprenyl-phosphate 4-deoxy-4-formamido-L-arabinose transferase n=1 Tax=Clostridium felsineum TaxID=36839 RepID=A0A1S8MDI5_9CLOT|nr:glycosyltransferase [Clostridium felsineum]URZ06308.1 Undecaprenyl-phosphate 4-deoxy-4-formamido-L-arabinose transferase [Clostridium felsineum]URZ11343.1 Undecaprenyl-phosphate 4-deoxy-4-formamido-L-arabinose transferase [Clostridium felsineum]
MNSISVIMPVYNSEKYLRNAIESVLSQTYKNFEFIITNDGSTDNSINIINEYAKLDDRIIVVSRKNRGLVYTLNEAINLAKGEYIVRMDADDICIPERLEKQINFFKEHKDIDILGTQVKTFGDVSPEIKIRDENKLNRTFDIGKSNRETIINYWYCLAHPSIMLKKSILNKLKGYRNFKSEDLDLWLRAIKAKLNIYKLNEKLIYFRLHDDSKTKVDNKNNEGLKDGIKIKLMDVFENKIEDDFKYIIWGASNGGKATKEVVDKYFKKSKCVGFIDKFKAGEFLNRRIFSPESVENIEFDYVFIATEPGKEEAIGKLKEIGLKSIDDFFCTV